MELNGLRGPLPTCRVTAERRLVLRSRNNLKLFTWFVVLVAKDLWDRDSAQIHWIKEEQALTDGCLPFWC